MSELPAHGPLTPARPARLSGRQAGGRAAQSQLSFPVGIEQQLLVTKTASDNIFLRCLQVGLLLFVCFYNHAQTIRVFLLGDAGKPNLPYDATLSFLSQKLAEGTSSDVLLILGDNLYPNGLPPEEHPKRQESEDRLNAQLEIIKKFKGRSFMVPGNHDWNGGKKNGYDWVLRMQSYVEESLAGKTIFLPEGGCPGPVEIPLSDEVTLIILNTQYFLHPWTKPEEESACEEKSTYESMEQLNDVIKRNSNKHIIVAGHHPLYSKGQHGGVYTFQQHLFPLTDISRGLYIPLPVVGSIYPLYRKIIGSRQDLNHPRYRLIRKNMELAFQANDNLVYVSGHEHSLQYLKTGKHHYIVSGSGSKSSPVKKGRRTIFCQEGMGFASLTYQDGKEVSVQFWDGPNQRLLFEKDIYEKEVAPFSTLLSHIDFEDSVVNRPVSERYHASGLQKKILGTNYRDLWSAPVEMPVFNIGKEHGGLTIQKIGGGNQTKSLRMEARDGRQFVLRSLDKYTDKLLPSSLQETLAADILQDEISAANPYGAFVVPYLADAAGIYHTNPKMVFVPNDPRLGPYKDVFAGLVAVYEERPTDEFASAPFFGGGEKILSTAELIEKLHKDNDHSVDQPFVLRSRLFDNFLADWDRHDDQWRWVKTDNTPGASYRPIPRDRDQAFYVNEGLIPWIASRKWALPNTEGFQEKIRFAPGFNTSGRFFDRSFLNNLDWSDWESEIKTLQAKLSDSVIAMAFTHWPDTIQKLAASRTITILEKRRDDLMNSAREHYLFLAREVEVVGTDKHELFKVERLNDNETRVAVWKRTKQGNLEHEMFNRVFRISETREVRLYGLGGEDIFEITGKVNRGIRIRVIGGSDHDKILDSSTVKGWSDKTAVYDLKKNTAIDGGRETSTRLSNKVNVNAYNRTAFKYNKLLPLVSIQFNKDDGIFIGGGFQFTKHGWRREPWAQQHSLKGNVAFSTLAFNLYYSGTFHHAIGQWDWANNLVVQSPFGVSNYLGMGNESFFDVEGNAIPTQDDVIDYYRIRFQRINLFSSFSRNIGQKSLIKMGPEYLRYRLEDNANRFISSPQSDLDQARIHQDFQYVGMQASAQVDTRNHAHLSERGIYFQSNFSSYFSITREATDFSQLSGEFCFYLTAQLPLKITLANRVGAIMSFGDFEFFNGATLGKETLRGYRRARFIGQEGVYHNLDVRLKLAGFRTYLFPGSIGLLGFHDVGRVWMKGEKSNAWHRSMGAGLWIAPINKWVLAFNMAFTEDENLPSVTLGFHF